MTDGSLVAFGDEVGVANGTRISDGLVVNAGELALLVKTADGCYRVGPGEAVLVSAESPVAHLSSDALAALANDGCSVTCAAGYYACCNDNWWTDTCKCIPEGQSADCDSGGPGATSCSILPEPKDFNPEPLP